MIIGKKNILFSTFLAASFTTLSTPLMAGEYFNRVSSFPVNLNLPSDIDQKTESSAEIISASGDGNTLVYSDSPLGAIGLIDITDPKAPKAKGIIKLDGEPTSVSVKGNLAFVGVNTSQSYIQPSGKLIIINLKSKEIVSSCDLGGQPDSVALSLDGTLVAVAIENERDEDLNDGVIPQAPAGFVSILPVQDGELDCGATINADVTGLAGIAQSDPEPEFVDFNANNELVVTLQENNHIVVLNADGSVASHFSAGTVDLENVDVGEEGALTFDGTLKDVPREPDAVQWLDEDRILIANEGDYKGGSRGFTIFSKAGEVLFESGLDFEYKVAMAGHYPEKRSGNKGAEPEGLEVGTFGAQKHMFVLSERGSVIGVYKDTGKDAEFVQLLPTGLAPEGAIAIEGRNLLAVSNEKDLIEDGGVRSHVTLYQYGADTSQYPMLTSIPDENGRPIGWGALSGLVADSEKPGMLYAVNDSFYRSQPQIFKIDATQIPAQIISATPITRDGLAAQKLDMEGITQDGEGGFFIASEGRTDRLTPHAIYHVNAVGEIKNEIAFPAELLAVEKRFGSEGITKFGDDLWIAIQREWKDDEPGFVKLVNYNLETKEWGAVQYPLDGKDKGWVGLSDITIFGEYAYIIERDNQIGAAAVTKKIYKVAVSELKPGKLGETLPVVNKELVVDLLPIMQSYGGYVVDKVEGLAIDKDGQMFVVTDNDGVDDSNGETQFIKLDVIATM
ncbi:MAG: esterase-like activity of phytase family protein [Lentilitoribacter sp.]